MYRYRSFVSGIIFEKSMRGINMIGCFICECLFNKEETIRCDGTYVKGINKSTIQHWCRDCYEAYLFLYDPT